MTDTPVSYKDPLYASLDAKTEAKLGLPDGLLAGIRTKGERSNADQVSEAGAKSVYQIIPTTRDAVLKKYGIDAYLSPENASEAAGLLLKESLERNKGDARLAVAEYHGGTDRANWGPRTKAYVGRVSGGLPAADAAPAAPAVQGQSTYDKVMASMTQPEESTMASVLSAYQSGKMSPEDAKAFEGEVKAGRVMLPRGASLKTDAPADASSAPPMPDALAKAYQSGQMESADKAQLDELIKKGVVAAPKGASQIPGVSADAPTNIAQRVPDPTFGERVLGTGEAALSLGTGLAAGAVAPVVGLADAFTNPDPSRGSLQAASDTAGRVAGDFTYQPRTESGQSQTAFAGEALANAIPLAGMGGEMAALARAGQVAKPTAAVIPAVARDALGTAATKVAETARAAVPDAVAAIPGKVAEMVGREPAAAKPTPGTMGSVGAMGVDMATQRRMAAQELPTPIKLTEGQATRDFTQQRFEGETAKNPEIGAPIRERFSEQNKQVRQNIDSFFDSTGAEKVDLRSAGIAVDEALQKQLARDKAEVNSKYATARRSEEAKAPVDQSMVVSIGEGDNAVASTPLAFINEQPTGLPSSGVADAARQYAVRLGVADLVDGQLVAKPTTVAQMEAWRKSINEATGYDAPDIRQSTILKKLIDGQTEPVAGPLYREARNSRARLAQNYEDRATIAKLVNNKRGTADRQVAFEDVFKHTILDGSLDDVRNVRRVLQRGGEEGQQAWKELQGQAINHIREEAFKNMARNERGDIIVSEAGLTKAVKQLEADGKLDFLFGKRGAEQIRLIRDVVSDIKNVTPGATNPSNTASILAGLVDVAFTAGSGGVPLPIASGLRLAVNNVKDRRLRMRVAVALGDAKRKEAARPQSAPAKKPAPTKKTIH